MTRDVAINRNKLAGEIALRSRTNDGETENVRAQSRLATLKGKKDKGRREKESEREKKKGGALNPCKKEERVSSALIPEINDFMLGLRRVIVGALVSLPPPSPSPFSPSCCRFGRPFHPASPLREKRNGA